MPFTSGRAAEGLLAALKGRGIELSTPVHQDDQAYAPEGWSYGDSTLGVSFVRLRTVDGVHTFTLKRPAENAVERLLVLGRRNVPAVRM